MKKIPTLFQRDAEDRRKITDQVTPGCEWVLAGEGVPTRKWDGTCVRLDDDGVWWTRREVKPGKAIPPNFVTVDHDAVTGKLQGWEPIAQSAFRKFHAEALELGDAELTPGTYELVGPKINGNPDAFGGHRLVRHGHASLTEDVLVTNPPPRAHEGLGLWLWSRDWEGLVFHRDPGDPDTDMVKIKRRDYFPGQAWPSPEAV